MRRRLLVGGLGLAAGVWVGCGSFGAGQGPASVTDAGPDVAETGADAPEAPDAAATRDAADAGDAAKGDGACVRPPPIFSEDFNAPLNSVDWALPTPKNCLSTSRSFPPAPGGIGLVAEIGCTANGLEAFTVLQTMAPLPEGTHLAAELLVNVDLSAPEHVFAQALQWVNVTSNLRFFSGPNGVSVHVDNGAALAMWNVKPAGFYLLEMEVTLVATPDANGLTKAKARFVFDKEEKLSDLNVYVGDPTPRSPHFQIGPYFPLGEGSATEQYDSLKLWSWSCP